MLKMGIAFKLSLFIMAGITLIFSLVFGYNYLYSKKIILKNVEQSARNLAVATTNSIDKTMHAIEVATQNLATFLQQTPHEEKEKLLNLICSFVEGNAEVYGSTMAFEPYLYDKKSLYFAPYFYKSEGKTKLIYLGSEDYHYFHWTWYQLPKELTRPVWSEPYYDEGAGNIVMSTYSVPLYKNVSGKQEFLGILTADVSIDWLRELVSAIKIYQSGYGFLISRHGTIVTHPFSDLIMNETIFSVAEARNDTRLREIGRKMIKGESGFVYFRSLVTENKCWMAYYPIPSTSWSLAVIFPQNELMADIVGLNRTVFFLFLSGFLLLLGVIIFNARSITKPLRYLAKAARVISTGNFDAEFPPIKSKDEVGNLAESFTHMKNSLKHYIKNLAETTAVKERMESELKIARSIQMSFLPKKLPHFPGREEFEIHALLEPAREVGGDLYDFFMIKDDYLFFVVGDVSDKGIPASLFMAVTKTLLKSMASPEITLDSLLNMINKELIAENETLMFVTLFCGKLELKTGTLTYSNAGHNPPLIIRKNGTANWLHLPTGFVLGVDPDASYGCEQTILTPGDALLAYTDGVTEAMNAERKPFSEDRLMEAACRYGDCAPEEIVRGISDSVVNHISAAPQSDDITILVLKYKGAP